MCMKLQGRAVEYLQVYDYKDVCIGTSPGVSCHSFQVALEGCLFNYAVCIYL